MSATRARDPAQHLGRVFERFFTYRPDSAGGRNDSDSHSGLGLAIAAAIAEGYGGAIKASNLEAGGAMFEVRLPERYEDPAAQTRTRYGFD